MTYSEQIKEARLTMGWTVRDLARIIGKSAGYISKVECGIIIPSPEATMAFAIAFDWDDPYSFVYSVMYIKAGKTRQRIKAEYDAVLKRYIPFGKYKIRLGGK